MKPVLAQVKNVKQVFVAGSALMNTSVNSPRIGVIYGDPGAGKSRAASAWATANDAAFVTADATWRSPGPLLAKLARELGLTPKPRHTDTLNLIVETIARAPRLKPLVFDEADFLIKHTVLLDTIRGIHDMTGAPVKLIGMQYFLSRLVGLREQSQFVSRISQVVECKPFDREDSGVLLDAIAEGVKVQPDLVDHLHKISNGSARLLVVAMEHIERAAKVHGLKSFGMAEAEKAKLKFSLDPRPGLIERLGLRPQASI